MSQSIKKKLAAFMIVGVMAVPMVGFAQEEQVPMETVVISTELIESVPTSEKEEESNENQYIQYKGEILAVNKNDGRISIHVTSDVNEDEYGMIFHMSEDVSVWHMSDQALVEHDKFEVGMEVEIYYHELTPMALSLPGQLTPQVVVIQDKESQGSTYMGRFNEELISTDNYLKLMIDEDTLIVNQKGERLEAQDIFNQTALVFFGASTRSIPAQTTPSKIVVFEEKGVTDTTESEEVLEEVEEVKEMIALRKTATELGYKVQWNEDRSIELTKENQTIVIKVGEVDYSLNRSLGKFSKAPELRDGTLYVSASILDIMQ